MSTSKPLPTLTPEQLLAAREWVADCAGSFLDVEEAEDVDAFTDTQIIRGIARHYAGGIAAFLQTF